MPFDVPSKDVLASALRQVHALLASLGVGLAADDPLRLALPALPPASAVRPAADVLSAYAALYLHAELEDAAVLPAVESLAEQRLTLTLRDRGTAERLERFALAARDYPSAAQRATIFARLFGMGGAALRATQSPDDGVRLDFQQRLLRFATSVVRAEIERVRLGGRPGLATQAAWRAAAQDLQSVVAGLPAGSLVQWARRIHARVLQAFEVLGDAGLQRELATRTPWQTLQAILTPDDAARRDAAARRGAAGQELLRSLGDANDVQPSPAAVQAALRWLSASGVPLPDASAFTTTPPTQIPNTAFSARRENDA
jgi:hypothetical protein